MKKSRSKGKESKAKESKAALGLSRLGHHHDTVRPSVTHSTATREIETRCNTERKSRKSLLSWSAPLANEMAGACSRRLDPRHGRRTVGVPRVVPCTLRCTVVLLYRCTVVLLYRCTVVPMYRRTDVPTYRRTSTHLPLTAITPCQPPHLGPNLDMSSSRVLSCPMAWCVHACVLWW